MAADFDRIEFDDDGKPDGCMRRRFTLFWIDTDGEWRPQSSKADGKPVGRRRAQCFHARPEFYGFTQDGKRRAPMTRTARTENGGAEAEEVTCGRSTRHHGASSVRLAMSAGSTSSVSDPQ